MTLVNFEVELRGSIAPAPAPEPPVVERPYMAPYRVRTHRLVPVASWDWRAMRDYVMARIEDRQGAVVRDGIKESAIFKSFLNRWGDRAEPIARYLLEDCAGYWNNQPVSLISFCKGSDPYVANLVAERLRR